MTRGSARSTAKPTAKMKKETPSIAKPVAAPKAVATIPANRGPATQANAAAVSTSEYTLICWSRLAIRGVSEATPAAQKPLRRLSGAVTTKITTSTGPWSSPAIGMSGVKSPFPISASTSARRPSRRSNGAPKGSRTAKKGNYREGGHRGHQERCVRQPQQDEREQQARGSIAEIRECLGTEKDGEIAIAPQQPRHWREYRETISCSRPTPGGLCRVERTMS